MQLLQSGKSWAGLLVLGGVLLAPSAASATTFCVPSFHAGCPNNGANVAQASVEVAVQSNAADGFADTVSVAEGHTYTDANSLTLTGSDPLTVVGGGPSTVLTSSATANIFVVELHANNTRSVLLKDLAIVIPASFPDAGGSGIQVSGDSLEGVDIFSANPNSDAAPSWVGGGTFAGGRVGTLGGGSVRDAFRFDANTTAPVAIRDATIQSASTGIATSSAAPTINVTRTTITTRAVGGQAGISSLGGIVNVSNSVIETPSGFPVLATVNSAVSATINVDGTTIVNKDGANKAALNAQVIAGTGTATVNATGSIATGLPLGHSSESSAVGQANINIDYSNLPAAGVDNGPGTVTRTSSIEAEPLFTSGSDYRLQAASPSIDAADPASGLTVDFDSAPRPRDGDGNGSAIADQGAFERETAPPPNPTPDPEPTPTPTPDPGPNPAPNPGPDPDPTPTPDVLAPETRITTGPGKRGGKGRPRFRFVADEEATFECRLDKARWIACASPQGYKLRRKRRARTYVFAVRATDAAGNLDQSPATQRFKVKRKKPKKPR